MRLRAETLLAAGHTLRAVQDRLAKSRYGDCQPPTPTTIRRWARERRWTTRE
jgi:hypothetical protein